MAKFALDIPDDQVDRVVGALCTTGGYQTEVVDPETGDTVANPQTPQEFAKARVAGFIKAAVAAVETEDAANTARDKAQAAVDREIAIT